MKLKRSLLIFILSLCLTNNIVNAQTIYKESSINYIQTDLINKQLVSLDIIKQPNKLTYIEGDTFNTKGMIVEATYEITNNDGSISIVKEQINNYKVKTSPLTLKNRYITVSIIYNGKTYSTKQKITVKCKKPSSPQIISKSYKDNYIIIKWKRNYKNELYIIEASNNKNFKNAKQYFPDENVYKISNKYKYIRIKTGTAYFTYDDSVKYSFSNWTIIK